MTPSDEFAVRVAAALRAGEPAVPDALLPSIAARTAHLRQQRHPGLMSFTRIALQGGAALAVGWLAITMLQGMRPSTGPFDSATRDDFTLTLSVPRDTYRVGEVIEPVATLTYRGPEDDVEIVSPFGPLGFGVARDGGPRVNPASWRINACEPTTMRRNVALTQPFAKSFGFSSSDPDHAFLNDFAADPTLRLPAGIWRLWVTSGQPGYCDPGSRELLLETSVQIEVLDGPITATASSDQFVLALTTQQTVFHMGDEFDVTATITYIGAGSQEISAGATGFLATAAAPDDRGVVTGPFSRDTCVWRAVLREGVPLAVAFPLDRSVWEPSPGRWDLVAVTDFAANNECSGPRVKLRTVVSIEIRP